MIVGSLHASPIVSAISMSYLQLGFHLTSLTLIQRLDLGINRTIINQNLVSINCLADPNSIVNFVGFMGDSSALCCIVRFEARISRLGLIELSEGS